MIGVAFWSNSCSQRTWNPPKPKSFHFRFLQTKPRRSVKSRLTLSLSQSEDCFVLLIRVSWYPRPTCPRTEVSWQEYHNIVTIRYTHDYWALSTASSMACENFISTALSFSPGPGKGFSVRYHWNWQPWSKLSIDDHQWSTRTQDVTHINSLWHYWLLFHPLLSKTHLPTRLGRRQDITTATGLYSADLGKNTRELGFTHSAIPSKSSIAFQKIIIYYATDGKSKRNKVGMQGIGENMMQRKNTRDQYRKPCWTTTKSIRSTAKDALIIGPGFERYETT